MCKPRLRHAASLALLLALAAGFLGATPGAAEEPFSQPSFDWAPAAPSAAARALEEIRIIEDHRWLQHPSLPRHLRSDQPAVVEAALVAIGRIGDLGYTQEVIAALGAPSPRVRAAAAFALGLLRGDAARTALLARLPQERHPAVRSQLLLAAGRAGVEATIGTLAALAVEETEPEVQTAAAEGLGALIRRTASTTALPPRLLAQWIDRAGRLPGDRAVASAFALSVLRGAGNPLPEREVLAAHRQAPAPSARAYLSRVLQRLGSPACVQALARAVRSDPQVTVRAEAARQLGRLGWSAEVDDALRGALNDPGSQVVVAAAQALAGIGSAAAPLAELIDQRYASGSSPWIRQELLTALAAVDVGRVRPHVEAALGSADWRLRAAAIQALPRLGTAADLAALTALLADPDGRVVSVAIDALSTLDPSLVSLAAKENVRASLSRRDPAALWSAASAAVTFGWTDFAAPLAALYDSFPLPVNLGERETILWAIGALGANEYLPLVERGLSDPERNVVVAAADAYQALTGVSVSDRVPLASRVEGSTPSWREVARAVQSRVALMTRRGTIVLRMRPEAPLTAANFVRLVRQGFYDGKEFHRVVPNFVTQGGDPRGDGWGGSDRLVREEISTLRHQRETVGMATAGKDTATSQFYFNLGWNVHLDGNYTVFAEVISGMDLVDRLEIGDAIERALILDE